MPFTRKIRNQVLVAAARHCCICHNFRGTKVEVHHIVQEADGGLSDIDNAIVLCFDCHADVGHYNPRHPRGTQYTPDELKSHRDEWFKHVKEGNLKPVQHQELHYNYLLCKSADALKEIANQDLSRMPVRNTFLVNTPIIEFQRRLFADGSVGRSAVLQGPCYQSLQDFERNHPTRNDEKVRRGPESDPFFYTEWVPGFEEIEKHVLPRDLLTAGLLGESVVPADLVRAGAYAGSGCADTPVSVSYRLRDLWAVYLLVTNSSDVSVRLVALETNSDPSDTFAYRRVRIGEGERKAMSLPPALIRPSASVLFPVCTILPPWDISERSQPIFSQWLPSGQGQVVRSGPAGWVSGGAHLVGPAHWPTRIDWIQEGSSRSQSLDQIDLDNLYSIDRYWSAGCCPHIFYQTSREDRQLTYGGELFSVGPETSCLQPVRPPVGTRAIIIAELDNETTVIELITGSGVGLLNLPKVLRKGDYFVVPISDCSEALVGGRYFLDGPQQPGPYAPDPWRKRDLVSTFRAAFQHA